MVRRREKWLACAGVRFLRTCIASKVELGLEVEVRGAVPPTWIPVPVALCVRGLRFWASSGLWLLPVILYTLGPLRTSVLRLVPHSNFWEGFCSSNPKPTLP